MSRALTLSPDRKAFVEAQLASGAYDSADALVEAAIDLLRLHHNGAPLDALLRDALADVERNGAVELEEVLAAMDEAIASAR